MVTNRAPLGPELAGRDAERGTSLAEAVAALRDFDDFLAFLRGRSEDARPASSAPSGSPSLCEAVSLGCGDSASPGRAFGSSSSVWLGLPGASLTTTAGESGPWAGSAFGVTGMEKDAPQVEGPVCARIAVDAFTIGLCRKHERRIRTALWPNDGAAQSSDGGLRVTATWPGAVGLEDVDADRHLDALAASGLWINGP
jgi:hypothetical protein